MNELSLSDENNDVHPLAIWSDERLGLGVPVMDGYHQEFLGILSALATIPDGVFPSLFDELVRHTEEHFSQEEKLMRETGCPAAREHMEEHRRVLGDLKTMQTQVKRGRLAMPREYVRNHMPEWFQLHLVTMDSALAAHLKESLNLE